MCFSACWTAYDSPRGKDVFVNGNDSPFKSNDITKPGMKRLERRNEGKFPWGWPCTPSYISVFCHRSTTILCTKVQGLIR